MIARIDIEVTDSCFDCPMLCDPELHGIARCQLIGRRAEREGWRIPRPDWCPLMKWLIEE